MSFESRPDVCTDGNGSSWTSGHGNSWRPCIHAPVRVTLGRTDGQTISVRRRLGGRVSPASSEVDLGEVPAKDAALYLASLSRKLGGRNADEALSAAALADDVDLTPTLHEIVLDENVRVETRKQALFWLGQTDASTKDLTSLYERLKPVELREHFTFVVSQRRDEEGLDKLMDIAQHDRDKQIRNQAMFWLGQSHDPRAAKFFRDILTP